jgi:hypothetical protein
MWSDADLARLQEAVETTQGVDVELDGALGTAGGGEGVGELAGERVEVRHVFLQGRVQERRDRRKLPAKAGGANMQPADYHQAVLAGQGSEAYPPGFERVGADEPGRESVMDDDLERLSREELIAEVKRLRAGIRAHRDSTGHELCWHHPQLWGLLPEKITPDVAVPPWPKFLRGCLRYRESLDRELPNAAVADLEHE